MTVRVRAIHAALLEEHGKPSEPPEMSGVDYLIHTILSQNTTDDNRDRAWESLLDEFDRDYAAIETSDHDRLAAAIRVAGLAGQKATRIQHALGAIRERTGGDYSLAFLEEQRLDDALGWLTALDGVGPKTAGIVLLFHFEKPYFPVDTHCHRLATRFRLIPPDVSAARAHELLSDTVPNELIYSLHRLLIEHGRTYCTARNADCDNSVCRQYCQCEYCLEDPDRGVT